MKNILILCSVFFTNTLLYADDSNQKDKLIAKILKPDDSQKIKSFEALGPIGFYLKEITENFGQNKEKFQTILLDNLNEAGPNSSEMDSQEVKDAYKSNFTAEELKSILDLRENATWLKTNNPQYQAYINNRVMKKILSSAMPIFMVSFLKQIETKAVDGKNVSNKLLDFFQKEIDHPTHLNIKMMRDQYDQQIKKSSPPKASDGVTSEKIALAGEYMSHLYSPDQILGPIITIITMILKKIEDHANTEKGILLNIIDAFMKHEGNTFLNQFYIDTFIKANEKSMAEIFTFQELKEMVAFQNQPLVKKLNVFNRNVLSQAFMKGLKEGINSKKENTKDPVSFVRNAVNKALEKAKEMNLISEEALGNIQKEVLTMKM